MVTGRLMRGNGLAGAMVLGPTFIPAMRKLMVSAAAVAFASCSASRSVQRMSGLKGEAPQFPSVVSSPSSLVELTKKVLAWAGLAASSRHATMSVSSKPNPSALPFARSVIAPIIRSQLLFPRPAGNLVE
jgi:hypothetical protein